MLQDSGSLSPSYISTRSEKLSNQGKEERHKSKSGKTITEQGHGSVISCVKSEVAYNDTDNDAQVKAQRRKIQRRQANRKSAQLSRARKREYLDNLKAENSRLQRLVDALESQPEVTFCVTLDGKVTFVSERTRSLVYGCESFNVESDNIMISSLLSRESSLLLMTTLQRAEGGWEEDKHLDIDKFSNKASDPSDSLSVLCALGLDEVKNKPRSFSKFPPIINLSKIKYYDAAGYVVEGEMRASRVVSCLNDEDKTARSITKPLIATETTTTTTTSNTISSVGRKRTRNSYFHDEDSVSVDESIGTSIHNHSLDQKRHPTIEYVCVIRPSLRSSVIGNAAQQDTRARNPLDLFSSAISHANLMDNSKDIDKRSSSTISVGDTDDPNGSATSSETADDSSGQEYMSESRSTQPSVSTTVSSSRSRST
jgi:hypothetical protein